jgi:hypothetical protein
MLRLSCFAAAIAVVAPAFTQFSGAAPPPEEFRVGFDSITASQARTILEYLAGKDCAGRGTLQPGYMKAAEFVANKFKEAGLKPVAADGSYYQNVPFRRSAMDIANSSISVAGTKIAAGSEFSIAGARQDANVAQKVVFIRSKSADGALAEPTALADAIVILSAPANGQLSRQIAAANPRAILNVVANVQPSTSSRGGRSSRLTGSISESAARKLAVALSLDASIADASFAGETVDLVASSAVAELVVKVQTDEQLVPNVIGVLEGSDPVLKNEYVALGAHLDHLGEVNGVIYYGADDDGSGSTALCQIALAMSKNSVKPKRSIIFMAFCGEEMGLLGSSHYVNNPIFPLDKTVCLLQMDMIGRNEEHEGEAASANVDTIHLVGSKRISMELHEAVIANNDYIGFKFEYDEEDVYTRSDHYVFAAKGVPIAFVFSGFHPDYHRPTDTIEKINFDKLVSTARLYYLVAFAAANRAAPFKKDAG